MEVVAEAADNGAEAVVVEQEIEEVAAAVPEPEEEMPKEPEVEEEPKEEGGGGGGQGGGASQGGRGSCRRDCPGRARGRAHRHGRYTISEFAVDVAASAGLACWGLRLTQQTLTLLIQRHKPNTTNSCCFFFLTHSSLSLAEAT